jgi:ElaB/YqjD/DUF883 family membrane-anchored ribosome-binding protein
MSLLKRSSRFSILAAGIAVALVGCSDFPSEGILDTEIVRNEAKVLEVRGHVYGISPGTKDLLKNLEADKDVIGDHMTLAWDAHVKGNPLPQLTLSESSRFDVTGYQAELQRLIAEADESIRSEVTGEISEIQTKKEKLEAELKEVKASASGFNAMVDPHKNAVEEATKSLNAAIDAYNTTAERPYKRFRELADSQGLPLPINPLGSYQTLDFSDKKVPAQCPQRSPYTAVNLLAENKQCAYLRIPSVFEPVIPEVVAETKKAMLAIPALKERLGEKGNWRNKPTGAYAVLADAEVQYKSALNAARKKFGSESQWQRSERYLTSQIERLNTDLARYQDPAYLAEQMQRGRFQLNRSEKMDEMISGYLGDYETRVFNGITQVSELRLENEVGVFSDFTGDFESAVVVAEVLGEARGRRDSIQTVSFLDLDPKKMEGVETLSFSIDRDSVRIVRNLDLKDPERVNANIVRSLVANAAKS